MEIGEHFDVCMSLSVVDQVKRVGLFPEKCSIMGRVGIGVRLRLRLRVMGL